MPGLFLFLTQNPKCSPPPKASCWFICRRFPFINTKQWMTFQPPIRPLSCIFPPDGWKHPLSWQELQVTPGSFLLCPHLCSLKLCQVNLENWSKMRFVRFVEHWGLSSSREQSNKEEWFQKGVAQNVAHRRINWTISQPRDLYILVSEWGYRLTETYRGGIHLNVGVFF